MSSHAIIVLGAGAIGSTYGALLSSKNKVTLIGRTAHMKSITKNGLTISGSVNDTYFLAAETEIEEIPPNALILLTTKAQDAARTIEGIKPLLRKDSTILVLQNGLGIKEVVEKIVDDKAEIIRGLVTSAAELLEPGKVSFWQGETILEPTQSSHAIARVFVESGLKTRISNDIKSEIWQKLILNCVVNPLTAILRARNHEILAGNLKGIRHAIIQECTTIAQSEELLFETGLEECIEQKIAGYTNYSSMYQDIAKQRKTEIDFINGKIVELGRRHSIPTPVNEALVALIKYLEAR
ncbi:MAG: 2-dehydropantoate 2-reductase [Candidatus Bathyarchaeota archaeon]|nr:MAG: 2-dehydropantoate 2-reductase [Candidatus Bathyarchaeota archaeon]